MTARPELRELAAYDEDFLLWSEEQADLLRRRAAARPEAFAGLDIDNLVEEIADLGGSELRKTRGFLEQLFMHLIKLVSNPSAPSRDHWIDELSRFLAYFQGTYLPSMRQRIDVEKVWRDARRRVEDNLELHGRTIAAAVPQRCPFTIDELVEIDFRLKRALARVGGSLPA